MAEEMLSYSGGDMQDGLMTVANAYFSGMFSNAHCPGTRARALRCQLWQLPRVNR